MSNPDSQRPTTKPAFLCNICERTYTTFYNLDRHMRSHKSKRPFFCQTCSKGFTRADLLKKHSSTDNHTRQTQGQRSRKSQDSRVSRGWACIQCASSRRKCSDGHPCSRCKLKGLECSLKPQRETLEQQDSHTSEHFRYCQAQEKATWEEAQRFQVANYAEPQTNSSQPCVGAFEDALPQFQFSDEVWIPSPNQSNLPASQNSELAAGSQNMLSSQNNVYFYISLINPWGPSSF